MDTAPRALTGQERAVLDALLGADFPGVEALREQAQGVQVVGRCDCGCPTVYFVRGDDPQVLVAEGATHKGQDVLLFVANGDLASMESVWTTDGPPRAFPSPGVLRVRAR
jgi:hypothetical protein